MTMTFGKPGVAFLSNDNLTITMLESWGVKMSDEDKKRLREIYEYWNFYKGYHWENIEDNGKPQVTKNFCVAFLDKFVAFELGKGFTINMPPEVEEIKDEQNNPKKFLEEVWERNDKLVFCTELGQSKGVTGDGWVQIHFEPKMLNVGNTKVKNPSFEDPYGIVEGPGRIRLIVVPTANVFPTYGNGADKDKLTQLMIVYPTETAEDSILERSKSRTDIHRHVWTNEHYEFFIGDTSRLKIVNKYGTIPFTHVKNIPVVGETRGRSDLRDLIPINTEINLKTSDVSEIIDYHAAPTTIVFGARIGNLERGANKVWGGLPKDAKVENLELTGDLEAANNYIKDLKSAMHEIGGIPIGALGGELSISNTSAIALETVLMPLLEKIQLKHNCTKPALEEVNRKIILVAEKEGLITIPAGKRKDFFNNTVSFESVLPKDMVAMMQQISQEMGLGLEDREGALERLGRENITKKIAAVDADRKQNPELYGIKTELLSSNAPGVNADNKRAQVNAGHGNGPKPKA